MSIRLKASIAAVLFLSAVGGLLAQPSWRGYLVDAKCYEAARRNVNPWDNSFTDRDMDFDIRRCPPGAKTTAFALVPVDWRILPLDSAGNAKAAEVVRAAGKQEYYLATVAGEEQRDALAVNSISLSK